MKYFYRIFALPQIFKWAGRLWPWFGVFTLVLFLLGLNEGLYVSPADYQQGQAVRMMYAHVPAAVWSLTCYTIIGMMSLIFLIWRIKLAEIIARATAPLGLCFTVLALITGAIWGKPMWGDVVGVGCSLKLRTYFTFFICGLYRFGQSYP